LARVASEPLPDAVSAGEGTAAKAPWRVVLSDARGLPVLLAAGRTGNARELVLSARMPVTSPVAALLVPSVLPALAGPGPLPEAEVRSIPDRALAAWTRPAAEPSLDALRHVDESDRRWFWGIALLLLLIETWVRRDRQRARRDEAKAEEVHEHAA